MNHSPCGFCLPTHRMTQRRFPFHLPGSRWSLGAFTEPRSPGPLTKLPGILGKLVYGTEGELSQREDCCAGKKLSMEKVLQSVIVIFHLGTPREHRDWKRYLLCLLCLQYPRLLPGPESIILPSKECKHIQRTVNLVGEVTTDRG